MKPSKLFVIPVALLLAACGDEENNTQMRAAHHGDAAEHQQSQDESEPSEKHPRVGMTENQIRDMYGDPGDISHSSNGEVWHYWFNRGHAFIPYNFGYKARTGTFIFNDAGRLVSFDYNE